MTKITSMTSFQSNKGWLCDKHWI